MSQPFPESAKVLLITGATTGIGAAIATTLAQAGHAIWGTGRRVDLVPPAPGVHGMVKMDVTDPESVSAAIAEVIRVSGRLDAVVNNAGIGMMRKAISPRLATRTLEMGRREVVSDMASKLGHATGTVHKG